MVKNIKSSESEGQMTQSPLCHSLQVPMSMCFLSAKCLDLIHDDALVERCDSVAMTLQEWRDERLTWMMTSLYGVVTACYGVVGVA